MKAQQKLIDCLACRGDCCRTVAVQLDDPTEENDWDQMRWLAAHKNVNVYLDHDDDWMAEFITDCDQLDENNMCKMYHDRMDMCRNHDHRECEVNGGSDYFKVMLRTVEDVDRYRAKI